MINTETYQCESIGESCKKVNRASRKQKLSDKFIQLTGNSGRWFSRSGSGPAADVGVTRGDCGKLKTGDLWYLWKPHVCASKINQISSYQSFPDQLPEEHEIVCILEVIFYRPFVCKDRTHRDAGDRGAICFSYEESGDAILYKPDLQRRIFSSGAQSVFVCRYLLTN